MNAEASELQAFVAMLERAGIGHGLRMDHNPPGTAVQVEHEDDAETVSEWWFDAGGRLVSGHIYATRQGVHPC